MVLAEKKEYSSQQPKKPRKRIATRRVLQRNRFLSSIQITVLILGIFACGLFYIHQNNQLIAMGYKVEENKQKVAVLEKETKQLELEAAELQCPDRVAETAIGKLGMNKPDQYLLAVLPEAIETTEQQIVNDEQINDGEKGLAVALKKFIRRAEASPQ